MSDVSDPEQRSALSVEEMREKIAGIGSSLPREAFRDTPRTAELRIVVAIATTLLDEREQREKDLRRVIYGLMWGPSRCGTKGTEGYNEDCDCLFCFSRHRGRSLFRELFPKGGEFALDDPRYEVPS